VLVLLAVVAGSPSTASAATPSTSKSTTNSTTATAIDRLGHQDFQIRERATRDLWSAGDAAKPALQKALDNPSVSPEVRRRIRTILSNLEFGITPDMSDEIVKLMSTYRTGDVVAKRQTALTLAQRGASGARVLLKLSDDEQDPAVHNVISTILLQSSRELAVALIGDGDTTSAGKLLARMAESGDERVAMNYAAFLLTHGGLDEAIAAMQGRLANLQPAKNEDPEHAEQGATNIALALTFLHRAKGDLAAARIAAEQSDNDALLSNILIEMGDWPELARRAGESAGADGENASVEELSFAATFHRLAGDAAGVDRFASLVLKAADRQPQESWHAAEGLMLNGRVDAGIDVLSRHGHLVDALEFHSQRFAFDQIPRVLERARAGQVADLGVIEAKVARVTWFTGDASAAGTAIEAAAKECEKRRDLPGLIAAAGVATEMGLDDRAHWCTIAAMNVAQRIPRAAMANDAGFPARELFQKIRFRDPESTAAWWQILRRRALRDPAARTLEILRAIDGRTMPRDELLELCNFTAADALRRPPDWRDSQFELVAKTLADAGNREAATEKYLELARFTEKTNPARAAIALSNVAAFDTDANQWRVAADRYFQAWTLDRSNPVPLYLSGWSLAKAGDASIGEQRMERAHLIPLADQNRRYELQQALAERKLLDEAKRERETILRTSEFLSWRRSEALRQEAEAAQAAGDFARAVELWERAFLDNNSAATKFVDSWANISMPVQIRRTNAAGLIRTGDCKAGIAEAQACMAIMPGDADGLIEIVTTLDATGHKIEADAFYKSGVALFGKLCQTYPASGPLHNLYAWVAAKCRRELDAALTHAKRAVELQPKNTASIDTLAETHFQRGEFAPAIAAMQKCAELEPDEPRHKEQLERFKKAAAARPATP
jgi:tetratricopeptide (TPR) repeat protein